MRAAIYNRQIIVDDECSGYAEKLEVYCEERNHRVHKVYVDGGIANYKQGHPAFEALLADAKARKFETVIVWKLSMLARGSEHLIDVLCLLRSLGIDVICVADRINTVENPSLFRMVDALTAFKIEIKKERGKVCRDLAKMEGKPFLKKEYKIKTILDKNFLSSTPINDLVDLFKVSKCTIHRYKRRVQEQYDRKLLEWKAVEF